MHMSEDSPTDTVSEANAGRTSVVYNISKSDSRQLNIEPLKKKASSGKSGASIAGQIGSEEVCVATKWKCECPDRILILSVIR